MEVKLTKREVEEKVLKFKTRSRKGLTRNEIELLLKRFPSVSKKSFFDAMGICSVKVVNGDILFYRSDIITAIASCIEKDN